MFERFTEESRRALFFARATAQQAGRDAIDSEHLVAGVLRAAPATVSAHSDPALTCDAILQHLRLQPWSHGLEPPTQEIPLSPAVQRLLNETVAEADLLGHHRIRPAHMLLAVIGEPDSVSQALREAGVEREALAASASRAAAVDDRPFHFTAYLTGKVTLG